MEITEKLIRGGTGTLGIDGTFDEGGIEDTFKGAGGTGEGTEGTAGIDDTEGTSGTFGVDEGTDVLGEETEY